MENENRADTPYPFMNTTIPGTDPATPAPDAAPPAATQPARHGKGRRELYPVGKTDLISAGILAVLTFFFVSAGLWGGFRLGMSLVYAAAFLALSVYFGGKKKNPGLYGTVCGLLGLAMAPVFTLTSNVPVRGFCLLGGAALSAVWFNALSGRRAPTGDLGLLRLMAENLNDALGQLPISLRSLFSPKNNRLKGVSKGLLGAVCALPVLCAVVPLLIRSDAAFDSLVSSVFSDIGTAVGQLILTLVLLPFVLSFALSLRRRDVTPAPERARKGLDTAFVAVFLSVISVVYVVYLVSQLAYFFEAFRGNLPAGWDDYSEYARRGFFELCAVAGINLALLFFTVILARKKENRLPGALRGLGVFITLFTLLLIGTAEAKMALYIGRYGMTVLRLGTGAFMVFMAVVFVAVGLRLFTPKVRVLQVAAVTAALVLLVLGLGNINGVVAKYNYDAYVSGKLDSIDTYYLSELGPEGAYYLGKLTEREKDNPALCYVLAEQMYYRYTEFYECTYDWDESQWQFKTPLTRTSRKLSQFSLPGKAAYDVLDAFLTEYPDFLQKEGYALMRESNGFENVRYYFEPEESTTAAPGRD